DPLTRPAATLSPKGRGNRGPLTRPGTSRSPPGRGDAAWRPAVGRAAGSGDPRRATRPSPGLGPPAPHRGEGSGNAASPHGAAARGSRRPRPHGGRNGVRGISSALPAPSPALRAPSPRRGEG